MILKGRIQRDSSIDSGGAVEATNEKGFCHTCLRPCSSNLYPSDFDLWQQTGQTEMTQEMTDSQIRTQFPNRNITDVPPNNIK